MSDENNNTPFGDGSQQARRLLSQLNEAALALLKDQPAQARKNGAVVYLGNVHDAIPRALSHDPCLDPVDQMAWIHIRIQAQSGLMPDYADLATLLKASRPTVSRCLTMLRLTRWLSQQPVRDSRGMMRGSVYALHDEPASLADAFTLDARYMHLVIEARRHSVVQVRRVAELIYTDITRQLGEAPERLLTSPSLTDRYEQRVKTNGDLGLRILRPTGIGTLRKTQAYLSALVPEPADLSRGTELNYLTQSAPMPARTESDNFTQSGLALSKETLLSAPPPPGTESNFFTQSLARDPVGSLCSSSKDLDPTTTTLSPTDPPPDARVAARWPECLVWPTELHLNDNERHLLWLTLAELPERLQQDVLDEAAGTVKTRQNTPNPVRNAFTYTRALAMKAKDGQFAFTGYGDQIRATRLNRQSVTATAGEALPTWRREGFRNEADFNRFMRAYQEQDGAQSYEDFLGQWFGLHPETLHPRIAGFSSEAAVSLCHNDWHGAGRTMAFPRFALQWLKANPGFRG